MFTCEGCTGEYTSAWAAAFCCDPEYDAGDED